MKTIDDIIAEMRKDIPRVVDTKIILRNYADRIDAEVKALEAATCEKSSQVGNATKMREAAKATMKFIESAIVNGKISVDAFSTLQNIVSKALSAPARNCDLYATEPEAYQAYLTAMKNETKETYMYFEPWLFAKAKGEKK